MWLWIAIPLLIILLVSFICIGSDSDWLGTSEKLSSEDRDEVHP